MRVSLKTSQMRKKNLKVTFCNPTEPHTCKNSVSGTVIKFFLNLPWHRFLTQKLSRAC